MPSKPPDSFTPLYWKDDRLWLLDQTLLPGEERWIGCEDPHQVADAIRRLAVRGAPAIGVAAAFGLVLGVRGATDGSDLQERFATTSELLGATRPTAVNLRWALERGAEVLGGAPTDDPERATAILLAWALEVHRADIEANRAIGGHGAKLLRPGDRILTHCNAGALATGGYGTALGVVTSAWQAGRLAQVWVDETRPLLQGARLTAWELARLGIPHRLVTDSSVGALMSRGLVDGVVVGADRIAANGDTANKIGTYTVAVLAARHGVAFYVAAPTSTLDLSLADGSGIPIEERSAAEVQSLSGVAVAPPETPVLNLAFDVTPAELITAIITERGVAEPPFEASLRRLAAS